MELHVLPSGVNNVWPSSLRTPTDTVVSCFLAAANPHAFPTIDFLALPPYYLIVHHLLTQTSPQNSEILGPWLAAHFPPAIIYPEPGGDCHFHQPPGAGTTPSLIKTQSSKHTTNEYQHGTSKEQGVLWSSSSRGWGEGKDK